MILRQSGTGSAGLTSQRGDPLEATGTRDPRASLAFAVPLGSALGLKPRLELALPLGNRSAYASAGSWTFAPGLPVEWRLGQATVGAELALRLRRSVELGSLRWGSQAVAKVGVSLALLPAGLLAISAESLLLPPLVRASSERGKALGVTTRLLPAEWLLSVRSRPCRSQPWTLALATGAGLALSSESSAFGSQRFVAPTGPGLRVLAEVRYAPRD
jgi:OOP family OmpA-OmpF porin